MDGIQAAPDGQLWTLLGQADGSFGNAVALGTGIDALNVLRKTSSVVAWNAGASSAQTFSGAGYVETATAAASDCRIFGVPEGGVEARKVEFAVGVVIRRRTK